MAPKKGPPPPIDRPLSKAYLREFRGWSTMFSPGKSEPSSLRAMENIMLGRDGSAIVRPGLKLLTYDSISAGGEGVPSKIGVVSEPEMFFSDIGAPAILIAVRELDGTVGFRAILTNDPTRTVIPLTDPRIGFPPGITEPKFSISTNHVRMIQIDNSIIAMSDSGEPSYLFDVGISKTVNRPGVLFAPEWAPSDKLIVLHPDSAWILKQDGAETENLAVNPSFAIGLQPWKAGPLTEAKVVGNPLRAEIRSAPTRKNCVPSPLHDIGRFGLEHWTYDPAEVSVWTDWMGVAASGHDAYATSPRVHDGITPSKMYRLSVDFDTLDTGKPYVELVFYTSAGTKLGSRMLPVTGSGGRWVSDPITLPDGTVSLDIRLGVHSDSPEQRALCKYRNLMLSEQSEPTDFLRLHAAWIGGVNNSASVLHPPTDAWIESAKMPITPNAVNSLSQGAFAWYDAAGLASRPQFVTYSSTGEVIRVIDSQTYAQNLYPCRRGHEFMAQPGEVFFALRILVPGCGPGESSTVDNVMIVHRTYDQAFPAPDQIPAQYQYFDGNTVSNSRNVLYRWTGAPYLSTSVRTAYDYQSVSSRPAAETPAEKTLVAAGDADKNPWKMGLFYTFVNEVGESAPSMITEVRMSRARSAWLWQKPGTDGSPDAQTEDPYLCADQLYVEIPKAVFDRAVAEGAIAWNLYTFQWSDQDSVPVTAQLTATIPIDESKATGGLIRSWEEAGFYVITPSRVATSVDVMLPTEESRINTSVVPTALNGGVMGDRAILVGNTHTSASVVWSSSTPGKHLNFSSFAGGGEKTFSAGNQDLPVAVVLWQNPQSVDTITILCLDDGWNSNSYYMQPAEIGGSGTGTMTVMGFEQVTSCPGTVAPFGVEVMNNALYRPTGVSVLKSTAANYNVNHLTLTDDISDKFRALETKKWIFTAQLDNRLYMLVNNPDGPPLKQGERCNEIWVYDNESESGSWSRFLIGGNAVKAIGIGDRRYMSVSKNDGLYYLDPEADYDDVIDAGEVVQRPIPWMLETNTQGANRAHDAWVHLQSIGIMAGSFKGRMEFGLSGHDRHGRHVKISKIFTDNRLGDSGSMPYDVESQLLIKREMKEWRFWARSVDGVRGTGSIDSVQYRYTPISVNIGYELGSVETRQYITDEGTDGSLYSRDGVPLPDVDYSRP